MEHINIEMPTWDAASGACHFADKNLLNRYAEQMRVENVPWRERVTRLGTAKCFLQWRRRRDEKNANSALPAVHHPDSEAEIRDLRETYLRHACADRDLRGMERAELNHFLRYVRLFGLVDY